MTEPLPVRLHRAVSILSRTGDPGATDAQTACGEVAARLVMLEGPLTAMLSGAKGAADQARRVLTIDWSDALRYAKLLLNRHGSDAELHVAVRTN